MCPLPFIVCIIVMYWGSDRYMSQLALDFLLFLTGFSKRKILVLKWRVGRRDGLRLGSCQKSIPILQIIPPTVFKTGSCCFPDQLFRDVHISWILIFYDLWVKKKQQLLILDIFLHNIAYKVPNFSGQAVFIYSGLTNKIMDTLKKTWFADTLTVFLFFTF